MQGVIEGVNLINHSVTGPDQQAQSVCCWTLDFLLNKLILFDFHK
jgi:hypothetical protein